MTQIAYARTFDGSDDYLQMGIGGLATDIQAITVAAIIKPTDAAAYRDILVMETPMGFAFGLSNDDGLYFYDGVTLYGTTSDYAQQSNGWMLVALTKANGSATARVHRYNYSSQTWDHTQGGTTLADPTTPTADTEVYIGGLTKFLGMIACVGYWATVALTDGQLEGIVGGVTAWEALSPNSLWLLNQAAVTTTVEDRVGTSDEIARTGTAATSVSDLPFSVDQVLLPDADTDAGTWMTTPLYSKVNDGSDATYITETA